RLPKAPPALRPLPAARAPASPPAPAFRGAPKRYAILAGRLHPVSSPAIIDAVVLVKDGKVERVGRRGEVEGPAGVPVLTAAVVTPGLIDAHTVVGLSGALNAPADQDQDEKSGPNQADLRVQDGLSPDEPLMEFLRRNGVTTVHAVPGRANVIAGQ